MRVDEPMGRLARFSGLLFAASIACGKERIDEAAPEPGAAPWDPPTRAFGFRPVHVDWCVAAGQESDLAPSTGGPVEEIAQVHRPLRHLTADASSVYWSVGGVGPGAVYRATRRDAVGRWEVDPIARDEVDPGDVAVGADAVYWAAGEQVVDPTHSEARAAGVRFFDKTSGITATLATEAARPPRIVAHGASAFWVAGSHHLRGAGPDRRVRDLLSLSLLPSLLAVDERSVFAFTSDFSLVRVPRDGTPPVVLVPTTATEPVDVAVAGPWVYWIEAGPEAEGCCSSAAGYFSCRGGYAMKRHRARPAGALRRVPIGGGRVEELAADLPNVEKLVVAFDAAWITTARGPIRVATDVRMAGRPMTDRPTFRPLSTFEGRLAPLGEALVSATDGSPSRLLLLTP